jgi:hypothetical protein
MKLLFALIIVISLISNCKNNNSEFISKEYLKNADSIVQGNKIEQYVFKERDNMYVVKNDYYSKGDLLSIKGFLLNWNYGCNFFFFSKGGLKEYQYVADNEYLSYNIKYRHKLYVEEGTPLVDFWKKECKESTDSTGCLVVHFSYFPRKSVKVQYSLDGLKYSALTLERSKLLPFILQGELKRVNIKEKSIFFIIDADDPITTLPGIDGRKTFHDTLNVR